MCVSLCKVACVYVYVYAGMMLFDFFFPQVPMFFKSAVDTLSQGTAGVEALAPALPLSILIGCKTTAHTRALTQHTRAKHAHNTDAKHAHNTNTHTHIHPQTHTHTIKQTHTDTRTQNKLTLTLSHTHIDGLARASTSFMHELRSIIFAKARPYHPRKIF